MLCVSSTDSDVQPEAHSGTLGVALVMAAAALAFASAGLAQDEATMKFGLQTWKTAGCADCHGPFANGEQDDDDYPAGPNLRDIKLESLAVPVAMLEASTSLLSTLPFWLSSRIS